MFDNISLFPAGFWLAFVLIIGGGVRCVRRLRDGSGLPMLAVLITVAVWYVGDALYNDYAGEYVPEFEPAVMQAAWWQVAWFVLVFLVVAPLIHRRLNARYLQNGSGILKMLKHGVGQPAFQRQLNLLFWGCAAVWCLLSVIAAFRLQGEVIYYFFPFLSYKAEPWGRGRIGAGFDALISVAAYVDQLAAATFGVVAALSTNRRNRWLAVGFCLLSWPYFVFDRTRYTIVAAVTPAIASWVCLRVRGGWMKKAILLLAFFLVINAWFKFIIANRSDMSIMAALKEKGFSFSDTKKVHHEGLNMYEELCWMTTFIEQGIYHPSWGAGYFAEAANVIPRSIWPGKPTIGIAYAVARGQGGGAAGEAGVNATVSTGMIGQGVANFGRILGPVAAALIFAFWAAIVARLDLNIQRFGYLPLYATGLFVTFICGRDFCVLGLYPFLFGAALFWGYARFNPSVNRLQNGSSVASHGPVPNAPRRRSGLFQQRRPAVNRVWAARSLGGR